MGKAVYRASQSFLRCLFRLMGGLETEDAGKMPPSGSLIVASNHASFWDPMILGAAFDRPLHFMARKTLFDVPLFNWLIRQNNAFPLDREGDSREALRVFGEKLDAGQAVVMFPEGTRSRDGFLGTVRPGVGMLAFRNSTPVLPVYIWGGYQSWPRGRLFPRPHRMRVVAGDVILPLSGGEGRKDGQRRIVAELDSQLRELEKRAWRR